MSDQAIGGAVMTLNGLALGELGKDAGRERLAELDAPLIEAVDRPDHALNEDLVLVERDQRSEAMRREPPVQDRGGRPISREQLMRQELLERRAGQALRGEFGPRFLLG